MNETAPPPAPAPPARIRLDARAPWYGAAAFGIVALVYLLAIGFEALAVARHDSLAVLARDGIGVPAFSVRELAAHAEWRSSVLLFLGAGLAALVVAGYAIWRALRRAPLHLGGIVATAVLVVLVSLEFVDEENPVTFLYQVGALLQPEGGDADVAWMGSLAGYTKRAADVVAAVVGVGAAALVVLPTSIDARELGHRVRTLRLLLYASAVLFVVGILMTERSYAWLISFLSPADESTRFALESTVTAGTRLAGTFYTLLLAATYLPAAAILGRIGRRLAAAAVEEPTGENAEQWLERHGLSISWRGQLARLGALAAPLASSALAGVFTAFG